MTKKTILVLPVLLVMILASCKKDRTEPPEIPFDITGYFIAGTITPASNSYNSVYFIKLLEDNKAVFAGTGNDLTGDYTLTEDSLIVIISDPNNYREAKFAINKDHQLTSAYYKALTMEYKATGTLIEIKDQNQFAGKTFKGEEFKMGPASNKPEWFYKFNADGTAYGAGEIASGISTGNTPEIINNSAFKYRNGDITEIGFVTGDSLTVFRVQGLYYFGKYGQQ